MVFKSQNAVTINDKNKQLRLMLYGTFHQARSNGAKFEAPADNTYNKSKTQIRQ